MRRLCLALIAVGSFRSGHAELLYDPDQANGVPDSTSRRLNEAEFDQRSFALRRMSAEDVASSVTRRLVEPNNLAPNNDDVALDTYEERHFISPPSETALEKGVDFLGSLMVRKSRPVDVVKPADVPHPEEYFKKLGLHEKRRMDINQIIEWMNYGRVYKLNHGEFHIFRSSVEILEWYRKPKEVMKLLLLLRRRSDWKNAEYKADSLLDQLVLSNYDSLQALLKAWLDLRMDANVLYDLLRLDTRETLRIDKKSAIMWLRYNALLVDKGVRGAMTVDQSLEKLLGAKRERIYSDEFMGELKLTETDVDLYNAARKPVLKQGL